MSINISILPAEILKFEIALLLNARDLATMGLVNKLYRTIFHSNEVWKKLIEEKYIIVKFFAKHIAPRKEEQKNRLPEFEYKKLFIEFYRNYCRSLNSSIKKSKSSLNILDIKSTLKHPLSKFSKIFKLSVKKTKSNPNIFYQKPELEKSFNRKFSQAEKNELMQINIKKNFPQHKSSSPSLKNFIEILILLETGAWPDTITLRNIFIANSHIKKI
jgi:hypothetical protein